jgi:hypothetical protein
MGVGLGSGVVVWVGGSSVGVSVGMKVVVDEEVGVNGAITSGVWRKARSTKTAPIARKRANKPIADGRFRVTVGIRLPCTTFADCAEFSEYPRSAPQTRHFFASRATRVPHVGHSFVVDVIDSGFIFIYSLGVSQDLADYTSL